MTMIGKSANPVFVDFATHADTAIADNDYVSTSGRLSFLPGGPAQMTITVIVNGDRDEDSEVETFLLRLSNAMNAIVEPAFSQGVGIILDDDNRVARDKGDTAFSGITEPTRLDLLKAAIDRNDEPEVIRIKRQILNDAGLISGLVIFADPVDLLLTDLNSRTTGYTSATGEVTENARAYYSGDGTNELIIIPQAAVGVYDLALSSVGSGEFRTAATLFTADGGAKTITNSGTLSGDLQLALDFTADSIPIPIQPNVASELADAVAGRTATGTTAANPNELAFAIEAAQAMEMLNRADQNRQSPPLAPVDVFRALLSTVNGTFEGMGSLIQQRLTRSGSDDASTDPNAPNPKPKTPAGKPTLAGAFAKFAKKLLGAPGAILDLNVLELLNKRPESAKPEVEDGAKPDNADKPADGKNAPNNQGAANDASKPGRDPNGKPAANTQSRLDQVLDAEVARLAAQEKAAADKAEQARQAVLRRTDFPRANKAPAFIGDLAKLTGQQVGKPNNVAKANQPADVSKAIAPPQTRAAKE